MWWVLGGVAVVLAAALVVTVTVFAGSDSLPPRANGAAPAQHRAWEVKMNQRDSDWESTIGSWTWNDKIVVATDTDVTAYATATGEQAWQTKYPRIDGQQASACGAGSTISGDRVVLALGTPGSVYPECDYFAVFDLRAGKLGRPFAAHIDPDPDHLPKEAAVELVDDTVIFTGDKSVRGFGLDGANKWEHPFRDEVRSADNPDVACFNGDMAPKEHTVLVAFGCGFDLDSAQLAVQEFDAATGNVVHSVDEDIDAGVAGTPLGTPVKIVSADPPVLLLYPNAMEEKTFLLPLTPDLRAGKPIGQGTRQTPDATNTERVEGGKKAYFKHGPYPVLVRDNVLYATTQRGEPVAYSLPDGRELWRGKADGLLAVYPVSTDGTRITYTAVPDRFQDDTVASGPVSVLRVNSDSGAVTDRRTVHSANDRNRHGETMRWFDVDGGLYAVYPNRLAEEIGGAEWPALISLN